MNHCTSAFQSDTEERTPNHAVLAISVIALLLSGCASATMPTSGVPLYRVPPELLAPPKDSTQTINLSILGQRATREYRLSPRDVLAVWVEGVTGDEQQLPIRYPTEEGVAYGPSVGVPFVIEANGTVFLPRVGPVAVEGLTVAEAREAIRETYVSQENIIKPGLEQIYVSLAQPRRFDVLVFRQEIGQAPGTPAQAVNPFKRGTSFRVTLPAYQNDVLHALSETGGLPGLDAANAIYIYKNRFRDQAQESMLRQELESGILPDSFGGDFVYIPLRTPGGVAPPLSPGDIVLDSGDVVFVEARQRDVYYTAGLLPPGEFQLPQDMDLDVIEAIVRASGPIATGGLVANGFTLDRQMLTGQVGGPSPSMVIVMRKTSDGRHFPIRVDLNRAIRNPNERIIIHPQDVLILQQTPDEALARYFFGALRFSLVWEWFNRGDASGSATAITPLDGAPTIIP